MCFVVVFEANWIDIWLWLKKPKIALEITFFLVLFQMLFALGDALL